VTTNNISKQDIKRNRVKFWLTDAHESPCQFYIYPMDKPLLIALCNTTEKKLSLSTELALALHECGAFPNTES